MTTSAATASASPVRSVGFGAALASEWTKMLSLRSTKITVIFGVLMAVGMTSLLSFVIGSNWASAPPQQVATFNAAEFSLFGSLFSGIFFTVLGVSTVASEYSTGMMRLTLTATPRRTRVLVAKLVLVALVTLVAGTIATFGMFAAAQVILGYYGVPTASIKDSDVQRTMILVSLLSPVWPLIGASMAFLTRSAAASISSVMVLIFAPAIFGQLLPRRWQEDVLAYLPGSAIDNLTMPNAASPLHLETAVAAMALLAWLALFIGAALVVLNRRDA